MEGSFCNFQGMSAMAKTTSDSILGVPVIRKTLKFSKFSNQYAWRRSALSVCFSSITDEIVNNAAKC